MNEILHNIITRRSIRSFETEKNISKQALEEIAEAGLFAPSARNRQGVRLTIVQDPAIIRRLSLAVGKALSRDEGYNFYKPNTVIITSCDHESPFVYVDCACALENMFLYAHSIGIGSVWINQLTDTCMDKDVRAILKELDVPDNHICGGMAALGYALDNPEKDLTRKGVVKYFL